MVGGGMPGCSVGGTGVASVVGCWLSGWLFCVPVFDGRVEAVTRAGVLFCAISRGENGLSGVRVSTRTSRARTMNVNKPNLIKRAEFMCSDYILCKTMRQI